MRNNDIPEKNPAITPPALEGEGSYSGTRDYNQRTEEFLANNDPEALGKDAAEALEGDEGDELRAAEKTAKNGEEGMQANARSKQKGDQSKGKQGGDNGQREAERKKTENDKRAMDRAAGEGMIPKSGDKKN